MTQKPTDIDNDSKILNAINEVAARQGMLSKETYTQVMLALYDRLRNARTQRDTTENPIGPLRDELRLATVMFVDVVGSTELAQTLGDEQWRSLIAQGHRHLAATVQLWEGEIGQYLGDGMLCYFGARKSSGNDTKRAVSCALAMLDRMADYSVYVADEYGINNFAVRIGVATGQVVVGPFGADSDRFALGITTIRASRLQSLANENTIVIDVPTYNAVRSEFDILENTPVPVQGFNDPIEHYTVLAHRQQDTTRLTTTHVSNIEIPFVGRSALYDDIIGHMQALAHHEPTHAVMLTADMGMGKSRLLQEAARSNAAGDYMALRMVGHHERSKMPFSLVADMLYTICDMSYALTSQAEEHQILNFTAENWHGRTSSEAAGTMIGFIAGYGFADSPYIQALQRGGLHRDNDLAFEWVLRWMRGIAGERRILLLVDNLQWADYQSLALLEYLQDRARGVFMLAAARPEFETEHADFMEHQPRFLHRTLTPLSAWETQQLLDEVLAHVDNVPPELVQLIIDRSEGNPLFVEEFLRMLFDNGIFEWRAETQRWNLNALEYRMTGNDLPNGLMGVFQARLDDLSEDVREVVQVAAVVGQTFWEGAVATIVGRDVRLMIEDLMRRNIITERVRSRIENEGEYTFRTLLYHDVTYAMLPRNYRLTYHQQAADWLEKHAANRPDMLDTLAEQYTHAERPLDALMAYTAAAEYQLERGMLNDARTMAERGLGSSQKVTSREQALPLNSRLWLVQARTAHARHRYAEAISNSKGALRLLKELPDNRMQSIRVQAAVTMGSSYINMGSYAEAEASLTDVMEIVELSHDAALQSLLLRSFGLLYIARGDLSRANLYLQQAIGASERSESDRETAAVLSLLGRTALSRGDFSTALDYMEHVLSLNEKAGNVHYQISDLLLLARIYRCLFQYDVALQQVTAADRLAIEIGSTNPGLNIERGLARIGMGLFDEGMADVRMASEHPYDSVQGQHRARLAHIRALAQTGNFDECVQMSVDFAAEVEAHNMLIYGRVKLWWGVALHRMGQPGALQTLVTAMQHEVKYGGRDTWLCYHALSMAEPDMEQCVKYREYANDTLEAIAAGLYRRPQLERVVSDRANITHVFNEWLDPDSTSPPR